MLLHFIILSKGTQYLSAHTPYQFPIHVTAGLGVWTLDSLSALNSYHCDSSSFLDSAGRARHGLGAPSRPSRRVHGAAVPTRSSRAPGIRRRGRRGPMPSLPSTNSTYYSTRSRRVAWTRCPPMRSGVSTSCQSVFVRSSYVRSGSSGGVGTPISGA